jgi:hypothetical protein
MAGTGLVGLQNGRHEYHTYTSDTNSFAACIYIYLFPRVFRFAKTKSLFILMAGHRSLARSNIAARRGEDDRVMAGAYVGGFGGWMGET